MQTDQITDNQLRYLLILAWQRTDADEADIESYRTSFPSMTRLAANDLITTWNALPQLRADDPPNVGQAVPVTPPVSPPPVTHSTDPLAYRNMNARFGSTCAACNATIAIGGPIKYYYNLRKATHDFCAITSAHAVSKSPAVNPPAAVAPTNPGQYECYTCKAKFSSMSVLMDHKKMVHSQATVNIAPLAPPTTAPVAMPAPGPAPTTPAPAPTPRPAPYELPERGYYAVELPVGPNNAMVWRFYRVTQKRKPYKGAKNFMRQSGDNWVGWIDGTERQMAAAIIRAAPALAMEAYGKLLGHCGCCGRSLTDPDSIARGIGPECIKTYKTRR
jgi:hypothetical protein